MNPVQNRLRTAMRPCRSISLAHRIKVVCILLSLATILATACEKSDPTARIPADPHAYRRLAAETDLDPSLVFGQTRPTPIPAADPFQEALDCIGLQSADLALLDFQEAGYHMACRLPLIDHLAAAPFTLDIWADKTSEKIQQKAAASLAGTLALVVDVLNESDGKPAQTRSLGPAAVDFESAYLELLAGSGQDPDAAALQQIRRAGFTASFNREVGRLVAALAHASRAMEIALAALSAEERQYLLSRPERYFYPHNLEFNFLTAATDIPEKINAIARKIDFPAMLAAAEMLGAAVDEFTRACGRLDPGANPGIFYADQKARTGIIIHIDSPLGPMVILGTGNDAAAADAALLIDLGGDDHYLGTASIGHAQPGKVSLSIDVAGNDVYDRGTHRYAHGFGCLSIGMLVDLAGNDRYLAGNLAQGCGLYGVGLLADFNGDDVYQMGLLGQGFGLFGIGLLVDRSGSDRYLINGLGQGAGSTLGFGGLFDLSGNDKYLADREKRRGLLGPDEWNHVQGAGLSVRSPGWDRQLSYYGGIGFLSDGGGDDFYHSSDSLCMGSSYFMSVGALVDHGGADRYLAENGRGIAYGVHLSLAVLVDRQGDDFYYGRNYSGGVGSDRSVGFLADYAGDDTYGADPNFTREFLKQKGQLPDQPDSAAFEKEILKEMAHLSFGAAAKPRALGVLADYGGDDAYFASPLDRRESCGGVLPPTEPWNWSHALLLDLGGRDRYNKAGRKDRHAFTYAGHGVCYDTESDGQKRPDQPAADTVGRGTLLDKDLLELMRASGGADEFKRLMSPDVFVRQRALSGLAAADAAIVKDLVAILSRSVDLELNRDLVEILDGRIVAGTLSPREWQLMAPLLGAQDVFVRVFAANTLGWWKNPAAVGLLLDSLAERNPRARAALIRALGRGAGVEAVSALAALALEDPAVTCRVAAVAALAEISSKQRPPGDTPRSVFLKCLTADHPSVRTAAAAALKAYPQGQNVLQALRQSLADENVYVQRAAARSLILNGEKIGIPVLIETLNFPSIDTYAHYDHEIVKDLAYFCGVDFPEDRRYDYGTWRTWWDLNGQDVDMAANLDRMDRIETAFRVDNEAEGVAIFEKLLSESPQNAVVKKRYDRFCYEWITFRLLTRETIDRAVLERCLRLQRIRTEIDPGDAEKWVTLAYYNGRLNQYAAAIAAMQTALEIQPRNPTYTQKLQSYLKLKQAVDGGTTENTSG